LPTDARWPQAPTTLGQQPEKRMDKREERR
jgi:hypothetical protein